jgi:acetolactate synthase-1/2/3 large subunit
LPSEISFREISTARFPTLAQLGVSIPPAPDRSAVAELAKRLVAAKNAYVVVSGSGRDPATVPALVALCEMLGLPVVSSISRAYHSFPTNHPLYQGTISLADADFVLVLDADVPWMPGPHAPPSDAYVAVVALDPIKAAFPTYEFTADLRLVADPLRAIEDITAAAQQVVSGSDAPRFAERTRRWSEASRARWSALENAARAGASSQPIDPLWLGYQIGQALEESDIVIDDTLPASRFSEFVRLARPGSYFANPGTSGGWASGAALGAKFAAPERDVIAVTGDGFYMFGTPGPALWAAAHYKRPFITIVYQNRSYRTGTQRLNTAYPDSYAARSDFDYAGGYFDPPIDFAKEAEAAGAHGETVRDPADIAPAIKRARGQIRAGIPAVISVWMPKLLKSD